MMMLTYGRSVNIFHHVCILILYLTFFNDHLCRIYIFFLFTIRPLQTRDWGMPYLSYDEYVIEKFAQCPTHRGVISIASFAK